MYDFYERLRNGESAEDIAKSITDELNKAQAKRDEEAKKAEEASKRDQNKKTDADIIVKCLNTYLKNYYNFDTTLTTEDFMATIDASVKFANKFGSIFEEVKATPKKVKVSLKDKDIDEVFDSLFEKMGW